MKIMENIKSIIKKKHKRIYLLIPILALGILWQYYMNCVEEEKYFPPGEIITVNGHDMHIYAEGEGSPTIVLTVGSGTPCAYTDYYYVQKELSKTVRTISYDRPGFGWSESTTKSRTISTQVEELRELLFKSGEKPPYVLVGHSLSSLEVLHFAQMFPEEVLGIVLIDGGNPTFYANYSEFSALATNHIFEIMRVTGITRTLGNFGFFPPFVGENQRQKMLPDNLKQMDKTMFYNKLGLNKNRDALKYINENANEVIKNGKIESIPLLILTAEKSTKEWKESQIQLKTWSKNSKQLDVRGSTHYIHWDNPNIIVEKIDELINSLVANNIKKSTGIIRVD